MRTELNRETLEVGMVLARRWLSALLGLALLSGAARMLQPGPASQPEPEVRAGWPESTPSRSPPPPGVDSRDARTLQLHLSDGADWSKPKPTCTAPGSPGCPQPRGRPSWHACPQD